MKYEKLFHALVWRIKVIINDSNISCMFPLTVDLIVHPTARNNLEH